MIYSFKKIVMVTSLMIIFNLAWAGESRGLVNLIFIHYPNVLMFDVGIIYDTPSCNTTDQWAIGMDSFLGKAMLATLLSAQAQGKEVFVKGYPNNCEVWGDRELPSYIVLID